MKTPSLRSLVPLLLTAAAFRPATAWAIPTWPDDQPPSSLFYVYPPYPWVHYDVHYGEPGHSAYKGVWRTPNSWPGKDSPDGRAGAVTIRHSVQLTNARYYQIGGPNDPGTIPFPSTQGGYLECNQINLEPGGELASSLEILSFDGDSVWSGGAIRAGTWSNNDGTVSGRGRLRNKGTVTVTAPSTIGRTGEFYNTNRVIVDSVGGNPGAALGIESGHYGTINQSGVQPDPSVAVIELRGPGTRLFNAPGGGGGHPVLYNRGVLRKSFGGVSTISIPVENHVGTEGLNPVSPVPPNRSGTVQVDSGTLVFDTGGYGDSIWYGMKAEPAADSQAILRGTHYFRSGSVTVTGSGVLRLEGSPGNSFRADTGVTDAVFNAPLGSLESVGASILDMTNTGGIVCSGPSILTRVTNTGFIRALNDLQFNNGNNGTATDRGAVLEIVGAHSLYTASFLNNYGLLRKTGPGTAEITSPTYHYGGGPNLNIEVTGGSLLTTSWVYFQNGANIRVANGAEVHFNYRNYHDGGGTLNFTGSGKYYLNSGAFIATNTPAEARTLNSAPGVFDCHGGELDGPFTNAGEITVSAPSIFGRSFIGDNPITNAGSIHCLATSAGGNGSYSVTLQALVRVPCTASSVLSFDIAGRPTDYTQWARLLHGGQSSIEYNGTLRINFGAFTPVSGDRWLVIENYGSTANPGDFTSVEFTNVPAGFTPTFEKLATGIRVGLNAVPAPVNYAGWVTAQSFPSPTAAGFNVDFDGDGFDNGMECALGTDPKSFQSVPAIAALRTQSGGDPFFVAEFRRPAAALRATDVQYVPERSDGLGTWSPAGLVTEVGPPDPQGMETVRIRASEPIDYTTRTFFRLRVLLVP